MKTTSCTMSNLSGSPPRVLRQLTIAALCFSVISGCASSVKMAVPPEVGENKTVYPVDRPSFTSAIGSQTYTFGPFTADDVDRGVTSTNSMKLGAYNTSKEKKEFSFVIEGLSNGPLAAKCEGGEAKKGVSFGGGEIAKASTTLSCSFTDNAGNSAGLLEIAMAEDGEEGARLGQIEIGGVTIDISMTKKQEGNSLSRGGPTGFFFEADGESIGAVDVLGKGIVYVGNGLDDATRFGVASAATVLLIFQS